MWKLAALIVISGACASAEDDVTTVDPDLPAQDQTQAPTQINFVPADTGIDRAACQANGPCDVACDAALVEELFVPPGTCVAFDCGDGRRVGGCNTN